ncbi:MAG TPA: YdcF family protein [Acidobacteriaceae bacterium]|nr:YdcF family protein [Acidobacteriaceae bacterium]
MARTFPLGSAAGSRRRLWLSTAGVLVAGAVLWVLWVDGRIQAYAHRDEARPADAIAVFGAAEYDGRPSPVLRARLAHALDLYQRGLAPMIITLGGGDPADRHSEGGVGHDYLIAQGVPEEAIIAETQSDNTEQSAERLAVIARKNRFRTIDVVSDGTHLFRIHAICEHDGLEVYTSPRPVGRSIPWVERVQRLAHEIASYTAWRLHVH